MPLLVVRVPIYGYAVTCRYVKSRLCPWVIGEPEVHLRFRPDEAERLTVDTLKNAMAAKIAAQRLEEELRQLINGERELSGHELEALTLLAAARANVNPAYIIFYSDFEPTRPFDVNNLNSDWIVKSFIREYLLDWLEWRLKSLEIYSDLTRLPDIEAYKDDDDYWYDKWIEEYDIDVISDYLPATAKIIDSIGPEPERIPVFFIRTLLRRLAEVAEEARDFFRTVLADGNVIDVLKQAAEEARDRDAQIMIHYTVEMAEAALKLADELYTLFKKLQERAADLAPLWFPGWYSKLKERNEAIIREIKTKLESAAEDIGELQAKYYNSWWRYEEIRSKYLANKGILLDTSNTEQDSLQLKV